MNKFKPNYCIHPASRLTAGMIDSICIGATEKEKSIIHEVATRQKKVNKKRANVLHAFFGQSAKFWLSYQKNYDKGSRRGAKEFF